MNPLSTITIALAFAVLALAEPEAAGGFGGQPSFGGGFDSNAGGFGGQQRRLPYGADIGSNRNAFGKQRYERSPEPGQFGGRGGFGGNGGGSGGYGGNGGGQGGFGGNSGGRGGFSGNGGNRGGNSGFGGSSYARPQQQQMGLPYGANTQFGNQQRGASSGGFGRQNGGQSRGFGGRNGQFGY